MYKKLDRCISRVLAGPRSMKELIALPEKLKLAIGSIVEEITARDFDPLGDKDKDVCLEIDNDNEIRIRINKTNKLKCSYNGFSGVDIKLMFFGECIGSIQSLSYQVSREMAPIYTIGSADPKTFAPGKRAVAGSIGPIIINNKEYMQNILDSRNFYNTEKEDMNKIPPVNILVVANNEYGSVSTMELIECKLLDVTVDDILSMKENTIRFIAKGLTPWKIDNKEEIEEKENNNIEIINPFTGRKSLL